MPETLNITREALETIIENAFEAGGNFTIGSHQHFNSVHPDRITYKNRVINQVLNG